MIVKRAQLAAEVEVNEGVAETPAGADAFLASNITFNPEIEMTDRENVSASLSRWGAVAGARKAMMEFDIELKGSGAAGTAPAAGRLLRACGFGENIVSQTSVTYAPASAGVVSLTIGFYNDGVRYLMQGARGNFSLKLEKGKPGILHFSFTGSDFTVTDTAMLTTGVSYETTAPRPYTGATFTIDSYAAQVGSLEFNMNNEVALREDLTAPSGHRFAVITGRRPTLSIDPQMVTVAAYDFFGKWRSGSEGVLSIALTGQAGNNCAISAPKVQYTGARLDDKSGQRTLGIDCALNRNAGDDEISIVFT